jgi:hypothetical protein
MTFSDEKQNMYLGIRKIKSKEKIEYKLNIANQDYKEHVIDISIDKKTEIPSESIMPLMLSMLENGRINQKCSDKEYTQGISGKAKRINGCFGGLRTDHSNESRKILSWNIWFFPEWEEHEKNYIFDVGPSNNTNRFSIYRVEDFLVTEIIENNSAIHILYENVSITKNWHDLYFSLDLINKIYIAYLDNKLLFNFSSSTLNMQIPKYYYFGINSLENYSIRDHGNMIWDDTVSWNVTLNRTDIDLLYNNGTGCFINTPCWNSSK